MVALIPLEKSDVNLGQFIEAARSYVPGSSSAVTVAHADNPTLQQKVDSLLGQVERLKEANEELSVSHANIFQDDVTWCQQDLELFISKDTLKKQLRAALQTAELQEETLTKHRLQTSTHMNQIQNLKRESASVQEKLQKEMKTLEEARKGGADAKGMIARLRTQLSSISIAYLDGFCLVTDDRASLDALDNSSAIPPVDKEPSSTRGTPPPMKSFDLKSLHLRRLQSRTGPLPKIRTQRPC